MPEWVMADADSDGAGVGDGTAFAPRSGWRRLGRRVSTVRPWVWALPCLVVGAIYAVVWPETKAADASPTLSHVVLRWGHSAAWALLALSFAVRSGTERWNRRVANLLAVAALPVYAAFLYAAV